MQGRITGYQQDEEGDWVAELECGHRQHVRHNPPWTNRASVTTAEGRAARLGESLDCKLCDSGEPSNLKDDPNETTNLAAKHPDFAGRQGRNRTTDTRIFSLLTGVRGFSQSITCGACQLRSATHEGTITAHQV
jgi:Protein of unknown function (DUF3565)